MDKRGIDMDYEQAVLKLFDLPRFTKKHPLAHTKELVDRLGNPALSIPAVHVAGTNGKGSVCAFLTSIFQRAGFLTGTFTSPHLIKPNERICIGGEPVSDEEFVWAYEQADREGAAMEKAGEGYPTFFEMMFAMALLLFQKKKVDCLVLETGMGGRLDATNIIVPTVCAITSVSLDHMQVLGDTVEKIAGEKAGIIKKSAPVVFDASDRRVSQVLLKKAGEEGVKSFPIGKESYQIVEEGHNTFLIRTQWGMLKVPFSAEYQLTNACVAAEAASLFFKKADRKVGDVIEKGIACTKWPARMEEILPGVYLDGAHNEDAIRKLCETAQKKGGQAYLFFSVSADKDFEKMARILAKAGFKKTMFAHMDHKRALDSEELKRLCRQEFGPSALFRPDFKEALSEFLSWQKPGDTMYIAGSLYLAGDVKKILSDQKGNLC